MTQHVSPPLVLIPETAPFNEDQRAWLQSDGVGPFEVLNVPPTGARP